MWLNKHILVLTMFFISLVVTNVFVCSRSAWAKLPCSDEKTIKFATRLAENEDFETAQQGLNILLSLQSKEAQKALSRLKITGTAQHELWDQYVLEYDKKPTMDNADDKIEYLSCKDIKKLMTRGRAGGLSR